MTAENTAPAMDMFRSGQGYSFRTSPAYAFSPPQTGRYGAFKIIAQNDDGICVAILNGVFTAPLAARRACPCRAAEIPDRRNRRMAQLVKIHE